MDEVVLFMDDFHTNSYANYCRICHEAEYESVRKLEAPCACTGTAKFAHRECIQRWCDEKGNIICEICLQKYEPGYTTIPKQQKKLVVLDDVVSIRESFEGEEEEELDNDELLALTECTSTAYRSASYCKRVALVFTAILLLRHMFEVLSGGPHYPFSPTTIIILRSCGVIIPMCIIIRTISALQNSIKRQRYIHDALIREQEANDDDEEQQALER